MRRWVFHLLKCKYILFCIKNGYAKLLAGSCQRQVQTRNIVLIMKYYQLVDASLDLHTEMGCVSAVPENDFAHDYLVAPSSENEI